MNNPKNSYPNILIFIDWFIPGTKAGGPVRSMANLSAHLSDDFSFWIVTRNTDYCETKPYPGVKSNQWTKLKDNIQVFYASANHQTKKTFTSLIADTRMDSVYINGIYSYHFSILPLWIAHKLSKRVIVAPRGMLNPQAFSVKPFKKRLFVAASKWLGLYSGVVFHATNEDEKNYIQNKISQVANVMIAPNLPRKIDSELEPIKKEKGTLKLVNVARIAPEKGTKYILEYLKHVDPKYAIRLDIYGPIYSQSYWEECTRLISQLNPNISVHYMGAVDGEKVPQTIGQYHFFIMPSEGENFGHSILEALSVGRPVIISDQTPWKNLESQKTGWELPISDVESFVNRIEQACEMEQVTYNEWSKSSFNKALEFSTNGDLRKQSIALFQNKSKL